jgi:lipopolysaccharide/colanic/teichoic acid biosynthesis glycosyltransferase
MTALRTEMGLVAHQQSKSGGYSSGVARLTRLAFDVGLATALLIALLPLMSLIALCIVAESPGPVFYRARRLGRGGRPLRMLKFRKMAPDARGGALTLAADPRLTRVGALLAATKLDELPQLIHVVRGQMSLIGPRPEDPDFVARYREEFAEILSVRPGITGLSQLAFTHEGEVLSQDDPVGRYLSSILPQKLGIDRLYVSRRSLWMDLRILFWTFLAVFLRRPVAVNRGTARLGLRRRPSPHSELQAPALELAPTGQEAA